MCLDTGPVIPFHIGMHRFLLSMWKRSQVAVAHIGPRSCGRRACWRRSSSWRWWTETSSNEEGQKRANIEVHMDLSSIFFFQSRNHLVFDYGDVAILNACYYEVIPQFSGCASSAWCCNCQGWGLLNPALNRWHAALTQTVFCVPPGIVQLMVYSMNNQNWACKSHFCSHFFDRHLEAKAKGKAKAKAKAAVAKPKAGAARGVIKAAMKADPKAKAKAPLSIHIRYGLTSSTCWTTPWGHCSQRICRCRGQIEENQKQGVRDQSSFGLHIDDVYTFL